MDNLSIKKKLLSISIFLFFLLPIVLITIYHYRTATSNFDEMIKSRQEIVSYLSASLIGEKFNVLKEFTTSYSLSRELRNQVIQKKWDGAINIAGEIIKAHPDVARVAIIDPKGTLMAGSPAIAEVIGNNFAYRDWYKEVIRTDNTYLSDIFKRKAKPTYNVILISAPIKDFENNLIGILTVQVRVSRMIGWAKDFKFGNGIVYFVDKKGQVSGNPKYSELDEIIPNFSNDPIVKKVLQGKQGIEILNNSAKKDVQLITYSPIKGYGWGVIVQESITDAFKTRNKHLKTTVIFEAILMINNIILIWILLRKINLFDY